MCSPVRLTAVSNADAIRIILTGALAAHFPSNEKSAAQLLLKCCSSGLQGMVQQGQYSKFSSRKCYMYCREVAAQLLSKKTPSF